MKIADQTQSPRSEIAQTARAKAIAPAEDPARQLTRRDPSAKSKITITKSES